MATRSPRPSTTRRRTDVARAALRVVQRQGVGGATFRAVAQEAGAPLGTLTYYFRDKDELLREALGLWVREEVARVAELARAIEDEGLSLDDAAARCAAVLTGYDPEQLSQYELYLHAARTPGLRDVVQDAFRAYEEVIAAVLRAAGARDPETAAPLLLALADGLGLRRAVAAGSGPDLAQALRTVVAPLLGRGDHSRGST